MTSRAASLASLLALLAAAATAAPARAAPDAAPAVGGLPQATPRSFTAVATPDHVQLGERFTYRIEVHDDPGTQYTLPKDLNLGSDFELIKVDDHRETKGDEAVTRFDIVAAAFALDEKRLPDLTLYASGPDGTRALVIPGPPVTGVGALDDGADAQPKDALPPVELPVPDYVLLWAAIGAFAATLAAILLWRALRRRPRRAREAAAPPALPLEVRARAALEALRAEGLPAQGRTREHYFRLSEIVRGYLGERFGFDALDMTTFELLAALESRPTPGLDRAAFEAFSRGADLVKYARAPADAATSDAALAAALGFVEATTPAPVGTPPAAAPSPGPEKPSEVAG